MPGRSFAAGESVAVVARVALGGTPTSSSGDPFGELGYDVGRDTAKTLVIDRLAAAAGSSGSGNVLLQPANWKYLIFGLALVLTMRLRPQGLGAEARAA